MRQSSFGQVLLFLGLVLAYPLWLAAQGAQSPRASQPAEGPTDSDIYCAGFFTRRAPDLGIRVLGSESGGLKNEHADRDVIYLSKGTGTASAPGAEFLLVRPVRDVNPREAFAGQGRLLSEMGTQYAEVARIRVVALHEGSMSAEVVHACEGVVGGDLAIPVPPRPALRYRASKAVDRYAPSSGKPTGVVVAAKDFQVGVGEGDIVYLNVGKNQGAAVGQYARVFRGYEAGYDSVFQQMARNYPTDIGGVPVGRKLTTAERATLPRTVMGEVLLLSVEDNSSTGIVTFSRAEISPGDPAELE